MCQLMATVHPMLPLVLSRWKQKFKISCPFYSSDAASVVNWACPSDVKREEKQPVPAVYTCSYRHATVHDACFQVSGSVKVNGGRTALVTAFVKMRKYISMWVCRNAVWSSCTFSCLQFVSPVPCIMKRSQAGVYAYAKHGHLWSNVGGKKLQQKILHYLRILLLDV